VSFRLRSERTNSQPTAVGFRSCLLWRIILTKVFIKFPKNFYWGTATSAYQVEGGIKNDWSISGPKYDAGKCCDHYNRFEEDFDLAQLMHNNAHRLSIEWARIEPEQGKFDQKEIEHYRKVILALRERGLEPFATLYHWTLPVWFAKKGGWLNPKAPEYFAKFVEKIVSEYKDLVKFWITLNEPEIYSGNSYLMGIWPPFKKNLFVLWKVYRSLAKAHKLAYKSIKIISPILQVGAIKDNVYSEPYGKNPINHIIAGLLDYFRNDLFLRMIKNYQDFIGLNYYFHDRIKFEFLKPREIFKPLNLRKNENRETTDMGYEIYPEGIYHVLKDLKKYNKPIYITENGLADAKDEKRAKFIIDHLKWVYKAIEDGVDVRGYFHWSLLDNFEWDKGFEPRFGLIEINYNNLQRIPRPSSKVYTEICKNNGINIL